MQTVEEMRPTAVARNLLVDQEEWVATVVTDTVGLEALVASGALVLVLSVDRRRTALVGIKTIQQRQVAPPL
jgi:hypothetical protein